MFHDDFHSGILMRLKAHSKPERKLNITAASLSEITYNRRVQAEFDFQRTRSMTTKSLPPSLALLQMSSGTVPITYVRSGNARRYILRIQSDGSARVTLPRWGSKAQAYAFAQRESGWIEKQLAKRRAAAFEPQLWGEGTSFLFRGQPVLLQINREAGRVEFADQEIAHSPGVVVDMRRIVEGHLRELANKELVPRTIELAKIHNLTVRRVVIRNQKSRWGSCSVRGTISLNWRLIQTPPLVVEYIIIHELMHLREMNHSARFWRLVAQAFPDYRLAERWLKENATRLS